MASSNRSAIDDLIAEIYEVTLRPERYDTFIALWDAHVSGVVQQLDQLKGTERNLESQIINEEVESHFQRAFQILEKMGRQGRAVKTPKEYVDVHDGACALIEKDGTICDMNSPAKALLGPVTNITELTQFIQPADLKAFNGQIENLAHRQVNEQVAIYRFTGLLEAPDEEVLMLTKSIQLSPDQPLRLVLSTIDIAWNDNLSKLLSKAFRFSAGEVQVVKQLCAGLSIGEIAANNSRSVHTIRTQVKSLLKKANAPTQADLVRVIITLASFGETIDPDEELSRRQLEQGNLEQVILPDGRTIAVHVLGPDKGHPIIFVHGMLDGVAATKYMAGKLAEYNLRLFAPVRPHFGTSDPSNADKNAPEQFAQDLSHIMDILNIPPTVIIGNMAGAVYTFAAAAILGDRIKGILNVSGAVPILNIRQLSTMSRRQRILAYTARFSPRVLPIILRGGISQIDSGDAVAFMKALYQQGSRDLAVTNDMNIRNAICDGYRFTIAQGHRAFEIDSMHVTRNWSSYVEQATQPVHLLHGAHDPVIAIETVRNFADHYDTIKLEEFSDAGQLLFYEKPLVIFKAVRDMIDDIS